MRILVVCGAGASSTFVAERLTRAANRYGLEWTVEAGAERAATSTVGVDLVLVGPHLTDRVDSIRQALANKSPVVVTPGDIFTDFDGSRTLQLVCDAMVAPHDRKETP